ncbi:GNAT family N-acetyltransferase [Puia dinghuensis]|uniref:N-acetyltransferase n=1 Tax=Puia dinghuensis TaxID=1792502 RepID=A0A8J2UGP7_9BACT|nr:GNAT family N-acetyltransferase [Puia dinghuensis]GGB15452.1 N-acetyltransferase [Puia dinghuensis]
MNIQYKSGHTPSAAEVIAVYDSSGIRRPTDDPARIGEMYRNSNCILTAWDGDLLVGVSRAITDFHFCCYLSDLAIRKEYQHHGIGKKLVQLTKEAIGPRCMLLLLAAPTAMEYYPKIGMEKLDNAFMIKREQ